MRRQLAYILARQQFHGADEEVATDEALVEILSNTKLSEHFQLFGKELNLIEPRSLEDIYKSHLENTRAGASTTTVDSAKQNLAGTFVNAFVNVGFGNDKLMAKAEEGQSWIYKNKDHGMLSAAASLGLSFLWNPENGLDAIDTYTYAPEEYIKAGAMLANGIVHAGVKTEADAAFALLEEHIYSNSVPVRVSAMIG
jgi:26S proteasome regulatory subunit N1